MRESMGLDVVVAASPREEVGARTPEQDVVAALPEEEVVPGSAGQGVGARPGEDDVVPVGFAARQGDRPGDEVVAREAVQEIPSGSTIEGIGVCSAP